MFKVTIRRMLQTDLDAVSELSVLANPHVEKRKYRSHIIDHLELYPDLAFVAVHEGKVVGYVMGYTQDGKAWIDDIAVDINYQKKGIGKKLLKKELACLKEKGAKIVIVEVHHERSAAIPFYYKYGFRISGCMLDYFGLGHDAVFLQRVL